MIKSWRKSPAYLLAGLIAGSAVLLPAHAQNIDVGINAAVRNEVLVQSTDETEARQAVVKDPVFLGDEIVSFEDSALQVLLKDETVFTVGPNCEMVIDEFVYDPETADGSLSASITKGAFRFMSGNTASDPDDVEINTPVASMGVRGTMFEAILGEDAIRIARTAGVLPEGIQIDQEFATLVVLRGPGRQNEGLNKDGAVRVSSGSDEVTLWKSGTAVFVPYKNGPVYGPFPISREALELFSELLRTTPFDNTKRPTPDITEITVLAADDQDTGEFEFPWVYGEENDIERPDLFNETDFIDPNFPGPPVCNPVPGTLLCP